MSITQEKSDFDLLLMYAHARLLFIAIYSDIKILSIDKIMSTGVP